MNLIDITDMTDTELDALLSGTYSKADVETDAGAAAFIRGARHMVATTTAHVPAGWLADFCKEVWAASPTGSQPRPGRGGGYCEVGAYYEHRILSAQEGPTGANWTL